MKFLKKFILRFLSIVKYLLVVIIVLTIINFLNTAVYDYPEPEKFSGDKIYNPYQDIENANWMISNFHAHAKCWGGVTHGNATESEISEIYKFLGHDIIGISNYQYITPFQSDSSYYMPCYEHGYGITKTHQLVLGAQEVVWLEYPLIQTIHDKQHMLKRLKTEDNFVALAHPKIGNAYSKDNLKYLTDYDAIEAVNGMRNSLEYWDAALSAGHPKMILCSDDLHNTKNIPEVGNCITMINSPDKKVNNIISALKKGNSYGVDVKTLWDIDLEMRKACIDSLETIEKYEVDEDTLTINLSHLASIIKFIGQDGEVKEEVKNVTTYNYPIQKEDTYIRTEIYFKQTWNIFYMNPVFRYDSNPFEEKSATRNKLKTTTLHTVVILFLITLIFLLWKKWKRSKIKID